MPQTLTQKLQLCSLSDFTLSAAAANPLPGQAGDVLFPNPWISNTWSCVCLRSPLLGGAHGAALVVTGLFAGRDRHCCRCSPHLPTLFKCMYKDACPVGTAKQYHKMPKSMGGHILYRSRNANHLVPLITSQGPLKWQSSISSLKTAALQARD